MGPHENGKVRNISFLGSLIRLIFNCKDSGKKIARNKRGKGQPERHNESRDI